MGGTRCLPAGIHLNLLIKYVITSFSDLNEIKIVEDHYGATPLSFEVQRLRDMWGDCRCDLAVVSVPSSAG